MIHIYHLLFHSKVFSCYCEISKKVLLQQRRNHGLYNHTRCKRRGKQSLILFHAVGKHFNKSKHFLKVKLEVRDRGRDLKLLHSLQTWDQSKPPLAWNPSHWHTASTGVALGNVQSSQTRGCDFSGLTAFTCRLLGLWLQQRCGGNHCNCFIN